MGANFHGVVFLTGGVCFSGGPLFLLLENYSFFEFLLMPICQPSITDGINRKPLFSIFFFFAPS